MDPITDAPVTSPLDVSAWARIVAFIGVPSVMALGLVYWLTTEVSADLKAQSADLAKVAAAVDAHVADEHAEHKASRGLLYAICRGVNKSDEARELCEVGR